MLISGRCLAGLSIALTLAGCTITTYGPPPPAPPSQKHAAKPAPKKAAPHPKAEAPAPELAPRISAPIVFGNGKGGAFRGYAYVIPADTKSLPSFAGMVPFATLFTDSFQIAPQDFSGGFPGALMQEEWFAIRYEGAFAVPSDGSFTFRLASDDGAALYVDGQKLIDNDGQHMVRPMEGKKDLKAGHHKMQLDYFQAKKGLVALVLTMGEAGKDRPLVGAK